MPEKAELILWVLRKGGRKEQRMEGRNIWFGWVLWFISCLIYKFKKKKKNSFPRGFFEWFSGQFQCADWEGWDRNHGDRVEDSSLSNQLWMWCKHRSGFPQRRAALAHHGCAVHLTSISVSLRISLDVWQSVMGEGLGDVAHHGGLGDRHALGVQSWKVGRQRASQVSHWVNCDVSDGLSGYLLMSGGCCWCCCDWLRGGRCGARWRCDVCQLLMIGWQAMVDSLDDWRVRDSSVSDDGGLNLHCRRLEGMSW